MNNVWYYCTSIQIGYRLKMGETVTPGPILGSHERCKVQKRNIQSQTSSHDQSRLNTLNESMLSAKLAYRSSSYRLRRARKLVRSWMELYYIPRTAFLFTFGVRSSYAHRTFGVVLRSSFTHCLCSPFTTRSSFSYRVFKIRTSFTRCSVFTYHVFNIARSPFLHRLLSV